MEVTTQHRRDLTCLTKIFKCPILLKVLPFTFILFLYLAYNISLYLFQRDISAKVSLGINCDGSVSSWNNTAKQDVKLAMTIYPSGRLGNLMGQYASLLALSRLNGYKAVLLPEMEPLRAYFSLSLPTLDGDVATRISWKHRGLHDWMEPSYEQFNDTFVKLTGYPNSWTFYHHIRDKILREFWFLSPIVRDVQEFLHKVKGSRKTTTFIGVHVRRGDYVNLMLHVYDGVLADSGYLSAAIEEYRSRYSDSLFVVCSDDLVWCEKHIDMTRGDVILSWNGSSSSPGRDMALLSHCNHSIMTIGSFGHWASYLAGGDVIYLSNYVRPKSKLYDVLRFNSTYLPHWKGIAADLNSLGWIDNSTVANKQ